VTHGNGGPPDEPLPDSGVPLPVAYDPTEGGKWCGAKTRPGAKFPTCRQHAGWGTDHVGQGRCKLHGGRSLTKHGRYSTIKRSELRDLIAQYEADPDPLNIAPELATARALFVDYINRYAEYVEALLAWYQSWVEDAPPPDIRGLARALCDSSSHANLLPHADQRPCQYHVERARAAVEQLIRLRSEATVTGDLGAPIEGGDAAKKQPRPRQIMDIADSYRLISEITRIAGRIEAVRAANAISRPDFFRFTGEMGRIVERYVPDEDTLNKIKDGWLGIRLT
jgi:hypothetical protein